MKRPEDKKSREGVRVNGPYPVYNRWRIVVIDADGKQRAESYATQEEAEQAKHRLSLLDAGPSLWEAMSRYFVHLEQKGIKPSSVKTVKFRLQSFFALDKGECALMHVPLARVPLERCQELYAEQMRRMSVDTHRNTLTVAKTFGAWCVKQGLLAQSPLDAIEPMGARSRGKEQLRVDEARKFLATCTAFGDRGDAGAIGAMTALLLGLRGSEVTDRVVRDLDDDGKLLWIPKSKTTAGRRMLDVPESLRPYLKSLAEGKDPTDRLFTEKDRHWLLYHVRRMCREAGVPEITAHSLRGLHATLATEHGSTGRVVAASLGHTSFAMTTQRHYVAPGTVERVAQRRVSQLMEQPSGDEPAAPELAEAPPVPERRDERPTFRVIQGGLASGASR